MTGTQSAPIGMQPLRNLQPWLWPDISSWKTKARSMTQSLLFPHGSTAAAHSN